MAFVPREKLYGAGRGNRVMKAKRVTGPSANSIMNTRIAITTCSVRGCSNEPLLTDPRAGAVVRLCSDHIASTGGAWSWDKGVDPLGRQSVFGN